MGYTDTWAGGFSQQDEDGWVTIFNPSPLLVEWALQDEGFLAEAKTNEEGIRSLRYKARERRKSQYGTGIRRTGNSLWYQYHLAGKTYWKNAHTLNPKEAKKQRDEMLLDISRGKAPIVGGEKITFEDLAKGIERDYINNGNKSLERLKFSLKALRDYFGNCRARDITSASVSKYIEHRKTQGLSNCTINRELSAIRRCFNICRNLEMIDKVPHIKCLQETPPRDRWLTYEEEERLLSAPPEWLRDVIIFALETGWDQGEIIALLWTDIDMDKRLAIVPRQKTETKRSTPLSDRAFSLLKRLENNNSPVVFLNDMGEPINQLTLKWRFRVLCREVGIQNFRFKDLRHTFASG